MAHRRLWIVWQTVASTLIGIGVFTVYEVIDTISSRALSTWFNGGVNWILTSYGITSSMLEAILQGQNVFGFLATIFSFFIFMAASKPRPMGA